MSFSDQVSRIPPVCLKLFTFFITTAGQVTKFTTSVPLVILKKCWIRLEIQGGHPVLWFVQIFFYFLQIYCTTSQKTCQTCISWDHYDALLLFGAILNPRCLPWFLICRDIIDFFLSTIVYQVTRPAWNVLYGVFHNSNFNIKSRFWLADVGFGWLKWFYFLLRTDAFQVIKKSEQMLKLF